METNQGESAQAQTLFINWSQVSDSVGIIQLRLQSVLSEGKTGNSIGRSMGSAGKPATSANLKKA